MPPAKEDQPHQRIQVKPKASTSSRSKSTTNTDSTPMTAIPQPPPPPPPPSPPTPAASTSGAAPVAVEQLPTTTPTSEPEPEPEPEQDSEPERSFSPSEWIPPLDQETGLIPETIVLIESETEPPLINPRWRQVDSVLEPKVQAKSKRTAKDHLEKQTSDNNNNHDEIEMDDDNEGEDEEEWEDSETTYLTLDFGSYVPPQWYHHYPDFQLLEINGPVVFARIGTQYFKGYQAMMVGSEILLQVAEENADFSASTKTTDTPFSLTPFATTEYRMVFKPFEFDETPSKTTSPNKSKGGGGQGRGTPRATTQRRSHSYRSETPTNMPVATDPTQSTPVPPTQNSTRRPRGRPRGSLGKYK